MNGSMVGIKFKKSIDNIFGLSSSSSNCESTPKILSNFASVIIQDENTTSKPIRPQTLSLKNPIIVLERCDPMVSLNNNICLEDSNKKVKIL